MSSSSTPNSPTLQLQLQRRKSLQSPIQKSFHHLTYTSSTSKNDQSVKLYIDDEVCRLDKDGKLLFGIVVDSLYSGGLQIYWTVDGQVEIEDIEPQSFRNLRLIDRKVRVGDIVKMNHRLARVQNVSYLACVKNMETEETVVDVPLSSLEPVLKYKIGQNLVMDGWIGNIESINVVASLILPGGTNCKVHQKYLKKHLFPGMTADIHVKDLIIAGANKTSEVDLTLFKDFVEVFVTFVKVATAKIKWTHRLPTVPPKPKPKSTMTRSELKKFAVVLNPPEENIDSETTFRNFYRYTVQQDDLILPDSKVSMEKLLVAKLYPELTGLDLFGLRFTKGIINLKHIVRILRIGRVLEIKWCDSSDDCPNEIVRSSAPTKKYCFPEPHHEIVQPKRWLDGTITADKYGVTVNRDLDSTVHVQWFQHGKNGQLLSLGYTMTPKFDLEPHHIHGEIRPGSLVTRSQNCKLPLALWTYGIVQQINADGTILVSNPVSHQEFIVLPLDVEIVKEEGSNDYEEGDESDSDEDATFQSMSNSYSAGNSLGKLEKFQLLPEVSAAHHFFPVKKDLFADQMNSLDINLLLYSSDGIWIKGFRNRSDLFSLMIQAPADTPFADGLFFFDVQFSKAGTKIYFNNSSRVEKLKEFQPRIIISDSIFPKQSPTIITTAATLQETFFHKQLTSRSDNREILLAAVDNLVNCLVHPPSKIWKNDIFWAVHASIPRVLLRLGNILELDAGNPSTIQDSEEELPFKVWPMTAGFKQAVEKRIEKLYEFFKDSIHTEM